MSQTLYFATSNEGKIKEAQLILGFPIEIARLDLDEIQSSEIEEVVKKKVETAYEIVKQPVIVDDMGFYVDVWKGFPGPLVKFILPKDSNDLLLYMMRNETNRNITAVSAIGFCDGKRTEAFIGKMPGTLTYEEKGKKGFGFDPIVIPEGYSETIGELGLEVKNTLSHRYRSLNMLNDFLRDYWK